MKILEINNIVLKEDVKETYLTASASSGDGTITVKSITGFSTDQILLVGEFGREDSEIINTHASTSPSGTTITLASNLTYDHSIGTKIYILSYDQVEISHASSTTGSKSVLDTIDIQADREKTRYTDSTKSSGYYYFRWKDSINTTYSDYSDPVPYTGYNDDMVGEIIDFALNENGLTSFTEEINHEFCIREINKCLRTITGKRKKWHRLQEFDYVLGQTSQSEWRMALPDNIWKYSNKAILDVYLEGEESMEYKDEREWNEELEDVVYDTLASSASAGDTSITLNDSYSYPSSGTVLVEGQELTYTANDTATGVLSGIPASGTGSITSSLSSGSFVWYGDYEEGTPDKYTIKEGYLYFLPLPDSDSDNINVIMDYWKEAPTVDSDYDTIDMLRFDMVKDWLSWAIRSKKDNNGIKDLKDPSYLLFRESLTDASKIENNSSGQEYKQKPKLNKISY